MKSNSPGASVVGTNAIVVLAEEWDKKTQVLCTLNDLSMINLKLIQKIRTIESFLSFLIEVEGELLWKQPYAFRSWHVWTISILYFVYIVWFHYGWSPLHQHSNKILLQCISTYNKKRLLISTTIFKGSCYINNCGSFYRQIEGERHHSDSNHGLSACL